MDAIIATIVDIFKDWIGNQLKLLLTPMVAISAVIWTFRYGLAKVWGDLHPKDYSPIDRARRLALFLAPFVCGVIYMNVVSGTGWSNNKVFGYKEQFFVGVLLGAINTLLYNKLFKPRLFPWLEAKLDKFMPAKTKEDAPTEPPAPPQPEHHVGTESTRRRRTDQGLSTTNSDQVGSGAASAVAVGQRHSGMAAVVCKQAFSRER